MKFKLLLSFLFVIATTFTTIHELEHISADHDAASCQVCVLGDNSLSFNLIDDFKDVSLFASYVIHSKKTYLQRYNKKSTNQSNAPPFIS